MLHSRLFERGAEVPLPRDLGGLSSHGPIPLPFTVQKRYFTPIWISRDMVTVDVMRPQLGATWPAALVNAIRPEGTAESGGFRKLNSSKRVCTLHPAASPT